MMMFELKRNGDPDPGHLIHKTKLTLVTIE